MATIINTNNESIEYDNSGNLITISEISKYLNGVVEPMIVGTYWVFVLKNAKEFKLPLNTKMTQIIGFEVYGNAFIANDEELSPTFFFPKEFLEKMHEASNGVDLFDNNVQTLENDPLSNDLEKLETNDLETISRTAYTELFEKNKTFNEIIKNFVIFDDGVNVIIVPPVKTDRIAIIDKLISFFTEIEEYEKCINLSKFREKLIKYYEKF